MVTAARRPEAGAKDVPQFLMDFIFTCRANVPEIFQGFCTYAFPFLVIGIMVLVFSYLARLETKQKEAAKAVAQAAGSGSEDKKDK
mmetsp:Transcript_102764/g.201541  ORF Transcript_102764/g.201541 Transcript_102764/m.201541 type:complete len:86 (+) Transcript_102764:61-318(+)